MKKQDFESKTIEHPLVTTITNEVPVIRSICNYWRETIRQERDKRLMEFLLTVSERIASLEDDRHMKIIARDHIGSEDYFTTIEQLAEYAIKSKDESKIEYLKKFAINYSKEKRPDITLKEIYLNLINQLSGMHFLILDKVYSKQCRLSEIELITILDAIERTECICLNEISTAINIDIRLALILLYSLENYGLIKLKFNSTSNPNIAIEPIGQELMCFLSE